MAGIKGVTDVGMSTLLTPTKAATTKNVSSFDNVTTAAGGTKTGGSTGSNSARRKAEEAARKAAEEAARKQASEELARLQEAAKNRSQIERAVLAREMIRLEAIKRGKGFTQLEAARYLKAQAGQNAQSLLKQATPREGARYVDAVKKNIAENKQEITNLRSANLRTILNNQGFVTGFTSPVTQKSYIYNEQGVATYNRDAQNTKEKFNIKQYAKDYNSQFGMSQRKTTGQEAIEWFSKKGFSTRAKIKELEKKIDKLSSQGKKKEALKLAAEKNKLKNSLMGYKVGGRTTELLVGVSYIPSIGKMIYNNPKTIIPLAISAASGIKADVKDTVQLIKYSPREAVAKIGTDYFTFAVVGKVLKSTGRVGGSVVRKLAPKFAGVVKNARIVKIIKTNTGKIKEIQIVKNIVRSGKKTDFARSAERAKDRIGKVVSSTNKKISSLGRRASLAKKRAEKKISIAKRNVKLKQEIKSSLARAKKIRRQAAKKGKTVYIKGTDAKRAISTLEEISDAISQIKTLNFINNYIAKGGEITLEQSNLLLKAVKDKMRNELYNMDGFGKLRSLEKYSGTEAVKLIKNGKLKSAKIYFSELGKRINQIPIIKFIKISLNKIKSGIKYPVKRINEYSKKIEKKISIAKRNVKLKQEIKSSLARAKKIRRQAAKKGKTVYIGQKKYGEAVDFLKDFSDNFAEVRMKTFLRNIEKNGIRLSESKKQDAINAVKNALRKELGRNPDFIKLEKIAKINEPFSIKLIKTKKIEPVKILVNKISKKIKSAAISRYIRSSIKNIKNIPKKIKAKRQKIMGRKEYMKTIKYRMEKSRPIREVTIKQLESSSDISKMNKFIDYFFDNLGRKQKINISNEKFRQMKNLLKKRMAMAIKRNNKVELNNFKTEVRKLISDMNKKTSKPDIIVLEKVGKTKRFRTIKDFETKSPPGTFQEVKSGNQVLIQRLENKLDSKQATKQMQVKKQQIVSVKKKPINLKSIQRFAEINMWSLFKPLVSSTIGSTIKSLVKRNRPITSQNIMSALKQDSDFRILFKDINALGFVPRLNTLLKSASLSKFKSPTILKRKKTFIKKEKPIPKTKILSGKTTKILSKAQPTYRVVTRKRGKIVNLFAKPLTLKDAKDYLAYSVDNSLTKTAWLVPLGKSKNVASPPRNTQGYFSKVSTKLRPYKIKQGKKKPLLSGYIEKRKYFQDTPGERGQAKRLRRKVTPAQKKILIARLKKARAVRMRNLRRRK